jgi:hypothetical protein
MAKRPCMIDWNDDLFRLPQARKKQQKPPLNARPLSVKERARRMARSGSYGSCTEVELMLGRNLDQGTRAEVARLCAAATGMYFICSQAFSGSFHSGFAGT